MSEEKIDEKDLAEPMTWKEAAALARRILELAEKERLHAVREREECGAVLKTDGATFVCQLRVGHAPLHTSEGALYGEYPYRITWNGDMRENCEGCGYLVPETVTCGRCRRFVCWTCHGTKALWANPCRKCEGEPERPL